MLELGNIITTNQKQSISMEKLNPESLKTGNSKWMEGAIKFTVFNKLCACRVSLRTDAGGRTGNIDSFKINPEDVKQLNLVVPNIKQLIEGSMNFLIQECNWFYNETHEKKDQRKITSEDVIKYFSHVSVIGAEHTYKGESFVLIGLEGKYPVWDEEHGIGLKVVNGRVVSHGQIGEFL